jgi:hypothetical protein
VRRIASRQIMPSNAPMNSLTSSVRHIPAE